LHLVVDGGVYRSQDGGDGRLPTAACQVISPVHRGGRQLSPTISRLQRVPQRLPVCSSSLGNVRWISVRGVNAPLPPEANKISRKFDYEMVHSEVYLNKYAVSIAPFSTPACPDCSQNIQKIALFFIGVNAAGVAGVATPNI